MLDNLTEGATALQAYSRMIRPMFRMGYELPPLTAAQAKKLVKKAR